MIRQSRRDNGFTLLELIVAITLIAVMSVGVWTALDLCIRSWTRGIEKMEVNQRDRSTYDLVRKQIASAYPLVPSTVTTASGVRNTTTSLSLTSAPVFYGGENSLRFVTPNSLMSIDSGGLVYVAYEAEVDSNGNIHIAQREGPYTGQSVYDGGFTSAVYVFYNLSECTFEYYDNGDENNPAEWLTEWDTANRRRLPSAVRISMLYKDNYRGAPGRQMIIPLRAQYSFSQSQSIQQQYVQRRQQRTATTQQAKPKE